MKRNQYYTPEMISHGQKGICVHCNMAPSKEGHDGCLGTLPGNIMNACCGHGDSRMAYIQYWDRSDIRGKSAIKEQKRLVMQRNVSGDCAQVGK